MDAAFLQVRKEVRTAIGSDFMQLRKLRFLRRMLDLGAACLLGAVGVFLVAQNGFYLAIGVVLIALALNLFLLLFHEGMHGTLFSSKIMNYGISALMGVFFGTSFYSYRLLHTLHHIELGTLGDPDNYERISKNRYLLWSMYYIRLTTGAFMYIFLFPFLAWRAATPRGRLVVVLEYLLLVVLYITVAKYVSFSFILWYWFVPLILVTYYTALRGFAEHIFTVPSNPVTATRTIEGSSLTSFLMLNINYHLAHHLFPEVPSYSLPAMHEHLKKIYPTQIIAPSYSAFLWDFFRKTKNFDHSPMHLVSR